MDDAKWTRAVERARLATLKTFEGRMEAAAASLEVVPRNGKGAEGNLADFAEQAGLGYSSLEQYRQVWHWLGEDFGYVSGIQSWSVALEAKASGRWKTGAAFATFLAKTTPPLYDADTRFEPYQFRTWTLDALRVYLGRPPTNTGMMAIRSIQSGVDPNPDEMKAAEAADDFAQGAEAAAAIDDVAASRKAMQAAETAKKKVTEKHDENVRHALDAGEPSVHDPYAEVQGMLERDNLPSIVGFQALTFIRLLARVPEWMTRFGTRRVAADAETLGELMMATLDYEQARIDHAFDIARGNVGTEAEAFLASLDDERR